VANYVVQQCQGAGCTNFVQIATPFGTSFSHTGLAPETSYSYRVQAIDTTGNPSLFARANATTQTAPTAPGNLTATVASASGINLGWTASASTVGLAHYVVQRCQDAGCSNFALIGTTIAPRLATRAVLRTTITACRPSIPNRRSYSGWPAGRDAADGARQSDGDGRKPGPD
jgi:hypothetical protein